MKFYTRKNKSKSDVQAPNGNPHSIELQTIPSINNNTVELTKRSLSFDVSFDETHLTKINLGKRALSFDETHLTKIDLAKRAFSFDETHLTKIDLAKRAFSFEETRLTKIAKLVESIDKTPKDIKDITLEEGSAALAIGCCTGICILLKHIFTHDIPNPRDDYSFDFSDFINLDKAVFSSSVVNLDEAVFSSVVVNPDEAVSSPGVVNPTYIIDDQDAISLAGAESAIVGEIN